MDNRRSDWPLIKHLSKEYSPRLGFEWQRLPLIQVDRDPDADGMEQLDVLLRSIDREYKKVPFDDFVLDMYAWDLLARKETPTIHVWVRLSCPTVYLERVTSMSPWTKLAKSKRSISTADWTRITDWFSDNFEFIAESWSEWMSPPSGLSPYSPVQNAYRTKALDGFASHSSMLTWAKGGRSAKSEPDAYALGPELNDKRFFQPLTDQTGNAFAIAKDNPAMNEFLDDMRGEAQRAINIAHSITLRQEYLVEEYPCPPLGCSRRENDPKPWTYQYLPRIILLDPDATPSNGRNADMGGTHASPRPHQRRGHWATLRANKFKRNPDGSVKRIFRKPAWVGPREWIMEGNRYRVVSNQDGTVNA